mgnify:CR=1 FL=1
MKRKFDGEDPKCLAEMIKRCDYANKAVKSIRSMEVIEVYDNTKNCSILIYKDLNSGVVYILTKSAYCEALDSLVRCVMEIGYGLDKSPEELIDCAREFFWMGLQNSSSLKKVDPDGLPAIEVMLAFQEFDGKVWDSFNKNFADEVLELVKSLTSSKATEGTEDGKDAKEHPEDY